VIAKYDGGIMVNFGDKKVLFDPIKLPSEKPDLIAVTHAHSDHHDVRVLRLLDKIPKVMSLPTLKILDPKGRLRNVILIGSNEEKEIAGIQVYAHSSGHILGSLEFIVSYKYDVAFTGDFNLERRIILTPARVLRSDILVIEATYGDPRYVFPPRAELYRRVLEIAKNGGILIGRKIGVSQELTALLALSRVKVPAVHPSIAEINKIYEKFGEILGPYLVIEDPVEERPYIAPINYSSVSTNIIRCTGWALMGNGIPLSSHADFNQLVDYVIRSRAEKVYTIYGFKNKLAEFLKRTLGIDAEPLK